jgi:hypothetical protein
MCKFKVISKSNGAIVPNEVQTFHTRASAEIAIRMCQETVDRAILDLENLNDTSVAGAITELTTQSFEVQEVYA